MKRQVIWLFLVVMVTGCNLNNVQTGDTIAPTKTLIPSLTPDPSVELSPLKTQDSALSNNQPNLTPQSSATDSTCTPRTEWEIYAVQRGDNLSAIATRVGSTVDELIAANCLTDPNRLRVGQELYVPNLPMPTSTPSAIPSRPVGVTATPTRSG